jgi:NADH-quinone oxidoreductase subunit D
LADVEQAQGQRAGQPQVLQVVAAGSGPDTVALGPDHPTLDGLPTIEAVTRDGIVQAGAWVPGTVHRGAEKLFESRDYRQILMLVDRHDWLSAFCSELGVAVGVERALGLAPPPRAQQVRVLLAELTRIAHHLAFLAPLPGALPAPWRAAAWAWRGEVLDLVEAATGHRVHPMFCQVGGVRADVTAAWVAAVLAATDRWHDALPGLDGPALHELLAADYAGVAVLRPQDALAFGASGPVARASGIDLDLRRDDPALPHPAFDVPLRDAGDARARIELLVAELPVSLGLVRWAAGALVDSDGQPVAVRLPKVVRVPEGTSYTWTENPGGINGYLLASRNDRTPWRLKLRTAGFGNAAALGAALPGTPVAALPAAVASFLLVCGDVDR